MLIKKMQKLKFLIIIMAAIYLIGCQPQNRSFNDSNGLTSTEVNSNSDTQTTAADEIHLNNDNINTEFHITIDDIPAYSGNPYVEINNNKPFFTNNEITTSSFETYSPLDSIGRCTGAFACVSKDTMPTEERGPIGQIKPTGWHTVKYKGIDGNYLYNRCHLIAYCLTGENDNVNNLITGTRYLNIKGMLPFEEKVANYIDTTSNHVMYRVTPLFNDTNLLAEGVLMEGYSVEDRGTGINFCIFAYNIQPGIKINYSTGNSDGPEYIGNETAASESSTNETTKTLNTYIINNNTKKFHTPSCSSVSTISNKNKQEYTGTRNSVIDMGYTPCGRCNP